MTTFRIALLGLGIVLFSGCQIIDDATSKMNDAKKVVQSIQEVQENIETTKKELDAKIKEIQAAQEALSLVFGTSEKKTPEIEDLKKQALELQKRLEELELQNSKHLEDTSEFSIE